MATVYPSQSAKGATVLVARSGGASSTRDARHRQRIDTSKIPLRDNLDMHADIRSQGVKIADWLWCVGVVVTRLTCETCDDGHDDSTQPPTRGAC